MKRLHRKLEVLESSGYIHWRAQVGLMDMATYKKSL